MEALDDHKIINMQALWKWVAAGTIAWWSGLSTTLHVLLILMSLDYLSGIAAAGRQKRLSADAGFWGLMKKVGTLILIYAGHIITQPLSVNFDLGEMIALAYIVNEVISITDNCDKLGVYIPPILLQTLAKAHKVMPEEAEGSITTVQIHETVVIPPAKSAARLAEERVAAEEKRPE